MGCHFLLQVMDEKMLKKCLIQTVVCPDDSHPPSLWSLSLQKVPPCCLCVLSFCFLGRSFWKGLCSGFKNQSAWEPVLGFLSRWLWLRNPKAQPYCSELEQPRCDLHSRVPLKAEAETSLKSSADWLFPFSAQPPLSFTASSQEHLLA